MPGLFQMMISCQNKFLMLVKSRGKSMENAFAQKLLDKLMIQKMKTQMYKTLIMWEVQDLAAAQFQLGKIYFK